MMINKKRAFTMAEAILVMTILGIIATIMITTLKPSEFKDKGLKILAKKVLSEIDTATTQILINNSQNGTMDTLYKPNTSTTFAAEKDPNSLGVLYKRFLTATRETIGSGSFCYSAADANSPANAFYLKDGACMLIKNTTTETETRFPGEASNYKVTPTRGIIYVDTNGDDEPNVIGKDRFIFPLGNEGIMFAE